MGKSQKTRDEIDKKYTWDLTLIYENDELWNSDFNILSKEIEDVTKFKDKLTKSGQDLFDYLEFSMNIERKLYK